MRTVLHRAAHHAAASALCFVFPMCDGCSADPSQSGDLERDAAGDIVDGGGSSSGVSELESYVRKSCELEVECVAGASEFGDLAHCMSANMAVFCGMGWDSFRFPASTLDACLAAMSCEDKQPAACEPAVRALVPGAADVGEACASNGVQCVPYAFCDSGDSGCGHCVQRRGASENCRHDEECQAALRCHAGRCEARGALGDPCSSNVDCAQGICREGVCAKPDALAGMPCARGTCAHGYCLNDVCQAPHEDGEVCSEKKECRIGSGCSDGRCRIAATCEAGTLGTPCFSVGQCSGELVCDGPVASLCEAPLADGADCTDHPFACKRGSSCQMEGGAVCRPAKADGEPCASPLECASLRCNSEDKCGVDSCK